MKKIILSLLFLRIAFLMSSAQSLNKDYLDYIERYKEIAIANHKEFKIPASITLAQALLESGAGKSRLAVLGNNHFGVKCNSAWTGPSIAHDDDRRGECFRKYATPQESYADHARFISTRSRYAALFTLEPLDYEAWAWGLSKAGYATSREYAPRLIRIINEYSLHRYDNPEDDKTLKGVLGFLKAKPKEELTQGVAVNKHDIQEFATLPYIIVRVGDSIASLAAELKVNPDNLRKFNELPDGVELVVGSKLFLVKKAKRAPVPYFQHTVESGESLYDVAQHYGITVAALYKINRFLPFYVPSVGDVIRLR